MRSEIRLRLDRLVGWIRIRRRSEPSRKREERPVESADYDHSRGTQRREGCADKETPPDLFGVPPAESVSSFKDRHDGLTADADSNEGEQPASNYDF
jgi:hypothetical protein